MEEYKNDPVVQKYKYPYSADSDRKRLAALDEKLEREKETKKLIKSALSGQTQNKKIVFDDFVPIKKEEPVSKNLFEDMDDDADKSTEFNIPTKRFKGSKEAKIIELQSRFAHDPRFKIDDKFIDDDGDYTHRDNDKDDQLDIKKETEKELDILEEVLGKPIKRKFQQSEEQKALSSIILPRYDPSKPDSQKFKIRKVHKLEPYQLPEKKDEETDKPEVSKERFYEISETFKKDITESQSDGQSFSLSALFGRATSSTNQEDLKRSVPIGIVKTKGKDKLTEKSESSLSEVASVGKEKSKSVQNRSDKKPRVSNPLLKYERFFFIEDDERLLNNTFYNVERIKSHIASWKEKKKVMKTALTKRRRHFKHVSKLKRELGTGDQRDKDLKKKYRLYKETTKKH